ncbi:hypothetical protein KFE25_012567 [Diacronema lutheri]|uniref:Saposin B-type domain-containing protein n=1 Tax=Diacronema lutheri TaxID=2081491 RepID=A0A8J6CA56_DIALT|nr:hypothetical protein KFE25_012567 [Diacronema lutheri]
MAPRQIFGSDPRAPIEADGRLICHACRAVMHQLHHKLKATPTRSHVDVLEQLEKICDIANLKIYEYIPPKMKKGCTDFLGAHSSDELEEVIAKGGTLAHMSDTACVELTGVCEGIDWKAPTGVPGYEEYTPPEPQPTAASPAGRKKGKKSKKRLQHSGKDEV